MFNPLFIHIKNIVIHIFYLFTSSVNSKFAFLTLLCFNAANTLIYCCKFSFHVVRTILALCVIISYNRLSKTLEKQFGSKWLQWFTAITVTQSHFMFYLSRPLPNIMVLPLGNFFWLNFPFGTFTGCAQFGIRKLQTPSLIL